LDPRWHDSAALVCGQFCGTLGRVESAARRSQIKRPKPRKSAQISRYSQLYMERGDPQRDSERMRTRLSAFVTRTASPWVNQEFRAEVIRVIEEQQGCRVPIGHGCDLGRFFETAELRDVLDGITAVLRVLERRRPRDDAGLHWRRHVQQVFLEENMSYRLGDNDIARPFVDEEFQRNRTAAFAALDDARFGEARDGFEDAFRHLRNGEGKQAIRMMFPAVETAFKVLFPGRFSALDVSGIDSALRPQLHAKCRGNQPAIDSGRQLLEAFKRWIIASQPYRHGQEVQEPAEPPQELVVAHLSAGATFLRWMIELAE